MPMHEYRCLDCDNEFEMLVRPADPLPACPSCASQRLERVLSMFAVSSAGQSKRTLARAREAYRTSKTRQEQAQHQGEVIREHMQEDYGVDVERRPSRQASSAPTPPPKDKP